MFLEKLKEEKVARRVLTNRCFLLLSEWLARHYDREQIMRTPRFEADKRECMKHLSMLRAFMQSGTVRGAPGATMAVETFKNLFATWYAAQRSERERPPLIETDELRFEVHRLGAVLRPNGYIEGLTGAV